jgi:hypothetical protein
LLNGGHGAAMAEWHGGFLDSRHRKFVKEFPPWWRHMPQWRIYIDDFWPSTIFRIDNIESISI